MATWQKTRVGSYGSYHYGRGRSIRFVKFEIANEKEIISMMRDMGKVSTAGMTKAVKLGAKMVLEETKKNAPKKSGDLSNSLILVQEKSRKNKKGIQITPADAYNDKFQKKSKAQLEGKKSPRVNKKSLKQGNKKHAYYPASLEFGYEHFYYGRYLGYRKGEYFMKNSLDKMRAPVTQVMGDTIFKAVKKKWEKGK